MKNYFSPVVPLVATLLCGPLTTTHAQVVPLEESELSDVWGQALLEMTNVVSDCYAFNRITFNADVDLNAEISGLRLGEYDLENPDLRNGTGADIDIGRLQFGRSEGSVADRLVTLNNPYFEFVYLDQDTAATREVVGMRFGFEGIEGDIGLQMSAVSGAMRIDLGEQGVVDYLNDPLAGQRWAGISCVDGANCPAPLSSISRVHAGDSLGPSRDFFVSVLRQSVTFPAVNGVGSQPAGAGFWLNWQDRLSGALQNAASGLVTGPGG